MTSGAAHIFVHIQKTAGSSMRNSLVTGLPEGQCALLYPSLLGIPVTAFLSMAEMDRQKFKLIIGHFFFGIHRIVPRPARYAAFMRNPMERISSHFWQHRRFNSQFAHEGRQVGLATVVNEGLSDEFDNLQLRMIGGFSKERLPLGTVDSSHREIAKAIISAHFGFIGIKERLEEDWPRLLSYLGQDVRPLSHDNITPAAINEEDELEFNRIDWARVEERHAHEIALYEHVRAWRG